jgi:hypothetical protein
MFFNDYDNSPVIFAIDVSYVHSFVIVLTFYINLFFFFFQGPLLLFLNNLSVDILYYSLCLEMIK